MKIIIILTLFLVYGIQAFSQDQTGTIIIVDEKVGAIIDLQERNFYKIFRGVGNFESAVLIQKPDQSCSFKGTLNNEDSTSEKIRWIPISKEELERLRLHIRSFKSVSDEIPVKTTVASRGKRIYPSIEVGVSRTSFGYNDYISSRLKNKRSMILFNIGGFFDIVSGEDFALVAGVRYVKMGSNSNYYFVEPVAYQGRLEVRRDFLSIVLHYKFIFDIRLKPYIFVGPEFSFLISERIRNYASSDYQKKWENDNNPLFCDDCGYVEENKKFCIGSGIGLEFHCLNQLFYLQTFCSYGVRSSSACYSYSTREFNLSLGYKF